MYSTGSNIVRLVKTYIKELNKKIDHTSINKTVFNLIHLTTVHEESTFQCLMKIESLRSDIKFANP